MVLSAARSALVAGRSMEGLGMEKKTRKVRVLRAFLFNGKRVEVNETIELPRFLAIDVCAANKAEFVEKSPKEPPIDKDEESPKEEPARKPHTVERGRGSRNAR